MLKTLKGYVASLADPAMENVAISAEAHLAVFHGRSGAASRWLEETEPLPEGALFWFLEIPSITRCQTLMAAGSPGGLVIAEVRLRECAEVVEGQHNSYQLIRILTLLAMVCERQRKTEEALRILEQAVTMARVGNFFLPFVELGTPMVNLLGQVTDEREFTAQIERLVAAVGAPADGSVMRETEAGDATTETPRSRRGVAGLDHNDLTSRELDILNLLSQRLQNKEIAARLNISHQTVGSHLKQIYHKLDVHGRRKAVEEAVKRGLLGRAPAD